MSTKEDATKTWHDCKHIRKRTKFLLEHLEEIPPDVTFRVGSDGNTQDIACHRFIYTEEVVGLTMSNVMDCLYAAKKYLILRLQRFCRNFIRDDLDSDVACLVLAKAKYVAEENLEELASIAICSRPSEALASPSFLELSEDQLRNLLQRNDLALPEIDIYRAAQKWGTSNATNVDDAKVTLMRLLDCIRLPLMTPSRILLGPDEDGMLTGRELRELYRQMFVNAPSARFSTLSRTPRPERFFACINLIAVCLNTSSDNRVPLEGVICIEVFRDLVPLVSQTFIEKQATISSVTCGPISFDRDWDYEFRNLQCYSPKVPVAVTGKLMEERTGLLCQAPYMVSLLETNRVRGGPSVTLDITNPKHKALPPKGKLFARVHPGCPFLDRLDKVHDTLLRDWHSDWDAESGIPNPRIAYEFHITIETL